MFGVLRDKKTAVIKMASASGIHLVKKEEKNHLYTTTYEIGELIKYALDKEDKRLLIRIGENATSDGEAGGIGV